MFQLKDVQGATALHAASTYSEYSIAELLLKHGADPSAVVSCYNMHCFELKVHISRIRFTLFYIHRPS